MEVTLSAERPTPDLTESPGLLKVVFLDPSVPEPNNTHPAQAELLPKRPRVTPPLVTPQSELNRFFLVRRRWKPNRVDFRDKITL